MLDHFCVFTKGGALLWTWQMTALRGNPIDALVRSCLLEERSGEDSFSYNPPSGIPYTLKWTLHNVRLQQASHKLVEQLHTSLAQTVSQQHVWLHISAQLSFMLQQPKHFADRAAPLL